MDAVGLPPALPCECADKWPYDIVSQFACSFLCLPQNQKQQFFAIFKPTEQQVEEDHKQADHKVRFALPPSSRSPARLHMLHLLPPSHLLSSSCTMTH